MCILETHLTLRLHNCTSHGSYMSLLCHGRKLPITCSLVFHECSILTQVTGVDLHGFRETLLIRRTHVRQALGIRGPTSLHSLRSSLHHKGPHAHAYGHSSPRVPTLPEVCKLLPLRLGVNTQAHNLLLGGRNEKSPCGSHLVREFQSPECRWGGWGSRALCVSLSPGFCAPSREV